MKIQTFFLRSIILILLLVGHLTLLAQQRGGGGTVSNEQLLQFMKQGQSAGMSETEIMQLLQQQGFSAAEITTLKQRMAALQNTQKGAGLGTEIRRADTAKFARDSNWVKEVPAPKKPTPYYGFDFFNRPNVSYTPEFNASTPAYYVLGPGDQLHIDVTGLNERSFTRIVDREGKIEIPHGGFVSLNGLTVDQAKQRVRSKLLAVYPGLGSGRTQLSVTLGDVRNIGVTIIGEAQNPGTYTVSGLTSFFNILYLSGGPTVNGSLRNIELIRRGQVLAKVDFYSFLQQGILQNNNRLEDQDVIRFPVYTKRVALAGEVKRPAIYELLEKETLADLLQYAGGPTDSAQDAFAKVIQRTENDKRFRDVANADFAYFIPRNADSVYFSKALVRFANRVHLSGAVQRPGDYELTQNLTLKELLSRANGLQEDAFVQRAYIRRQNGSEPERELISFRPADVVSGAFNVALEKNDSVFIESRNRLNVGQVITVDGSVQQPMTIAYRPGMTVEDAILMAGGFMPDAALHRVEISRLLKNSADTLANQLMKVITVRVDSTLQSLDDATSIVKTGTSSGSHALLPLDHIFVPRLLNYQSLGSVRLRGEVLYPGDYVLERRDETVQELIARAGGITPMAAMSNLQVYRTGLRVGTNLFQGNSQSFLLQPADSIFIPKSDPFVEVKGQVFNPQLLSYQGKRFMGYISAAGGVTDAGNLKKAYVQYSNGINRKTKRFLFFRNYPAVRPGSSIIVPDAPSQGRRAISFLEVSAFTGVLTALVSLIAVLK
jgi:protein involved in polysaccharide export with SLBB domain